MNFPFEITTSSPQETQYSAQQLANQLTPGTVLTLTGELGSGKTTFIQALGRSLGITRTMPSPTFTLIRQYPLSDHHNFYHIDLYRLAHSDQVSELGISELISENRHIIAIEWPEKAPHIIPSNAIHINFHIPSSHQRIITFTHET